MNAQLAEALEKAFKTVANVKSLVQAQECMKQAVDYWLSNHLGQEWHLVNIDLTLSTNTISSERSQQTRKSYGILQKHSLFGFNHANTLWIYESDRYTETWVHELVVSRAVGTNNRILNVERNDPDGEIMDLGQFKLGI